MLGLNNKISIKFYEIYGKFKLYLFSEWAQQRNVEKPLHEQSDHELDNNLRKFYAEARKKEGKEYGKSTLLCLRSGIERYLNFPPYKRGLKFSQNPVFKNSNMMLNAKIIDLKQQGKQNVEHKPDISTQDLQKLKYHPVLSPSTPLGLLRNVWFHTTLYWCRRGREVQRNLTSSSFKFLKDENNRPYATMTHDESTKNHPGGVGVVESFEKEGRLYQTTDDPSDGFNALQFYISKLNPECTAFFQYPKRKWSPSDSIWYENRPLGIQKLSTMMKEMSEAAGLSKEYTNHSVRATAITLWSNAGLSNRHIMAISGHRNEQSLRSYNARPSSAQLQHSSDVLSNALSATTVPSTSIQIHPQAPQAQMLSQSAQSFYRNATFTNMFSGCSIGSVQVVVKPRGEVDETRSIYKA